MSSTSKNCTRDARETRTEHVCPKHFPPNHNMLQRWGSLPVLLLGLLVPSLISAQSFENTAIVRTVELGGSLVHVTTTYAVKALSPGSKVYTLALGAEEKEKTSWLEVKLKGQEIPLAVLDRGIDASRYASY